MASLLWLSLPALLLLSSSKKDGAGSGSVVSASGPLIQALPPAAGEQRERTIFDAVRNGLYDPIHFKWIVSMGEPGSALEGWTAAVPVMSDALSVDGVRVATNYQTAQRIADELGLQMMTPFLDALTYAQADAQLSPTAPQPVNSSTAAMVRTSSIVDRKLRQAFQGDGVPLVGTNTKNWVITRRFLEPGAHPTSGVLRSQAAANHGLYRGAFDPIQNVGLAHNLLHTDSTQHLRFAGGESVLTDPDGNDVPIPTAALITDPNAGPLVSGVADKLRGRQTGEGHLPYSRHPAIPPDNIA